MALTPEAAHAADDRRTMAVALGIDDTSILCELQSAGFSSDTIQLLHLVPFIAMAWAEGVARRERYLILKSAELRGVTCDSPKYRMLEQWLTDRPSDEFFSASLRAIRAIVATLPPAARDRAARSFLNYCMELTQATGGFHGMAPTTSGKTRG